MSRRRGNGEGEKQDGMREGDEERTKTWIRNLLDGYECGLEEVCPFESLYPPICIIPLHYPKWTLILPFHSRYGSFRRLCVKLT